MKTNGSKVKKRFVAPKRQKTVKRGIHVKGEWKAVELDPGLFAEEGLEGLVCFEELTDYRLIDSETAAAKVAEQSTKKAKKRKASEEQQAGCDDDDDDDSVKIEEGESTAEPPKKKAKKKKAAPKQPDDVSALEDEREDEGKGGEKEKVSADTAPEGPTSLADQKAETKASKKKKKKKKKKPRQQTGKSKESEEQPDVEPPSSEDKVPMPPKKQLVNWSSAALHGSGDKRADVSAWRGLFVPPAVLKALSSLGFSSPTPIQALALPSAIRDRMHILGAAETGSGKTLAFGIPMIHSILEWRNSSVKTTADGDDEPPAEVESLYLPSINTVEEEGGEPSDQEDEEDDETREDVNENEHKDEKEDEIREAVDGDEPEVVEEDEDKQLEHVGELQLSEKPVGGSPLLGLVLTPTRELAVQVKHHIDAIAKFTGINTAIVVGGMSQPKQRRMLNRRPEIVIATPGRLWDLIKEKHPHLANLRQLRCLVIDEADRMVERGHFAELENLLERLNITHFNPTRQMFVFSATLTMAHSLPTRLLQKKKKVEQRNKLEVLMEKVGIKSKPKVIDLTRKEATVETLTETQIHCQKDEKDFYLYYFLLQYPGRTMVFANSIDCIKRLNSLLVILDRDPLPLHANMHQKQRLKNLERFAERDSCVLLTTDVAARGLDIPNVQHVIHYQVPRTSETYVHRSGRTARATKEGLSLLLIGPDDMMNFKKIYKTLGKDEELPMFPVETKCMADIQERVDLARSIEKMEYYNSREKQHNSWFRKAAEAMEVDLDDDLLLGGEKDENADRQQKKKVKGMKKHLKHLISQPVFKNVLKTKYPTQMGKLPVPNMPLLKNESAITRVSLEGKKQKLKKVTPKQRRQLKKEKHQEQ